MTTGWQRLIPPDDCFRGAGRYPLDAYSEFLPPPRLGWKPYGGRGPDLELFAPDEPFGWHVGEFEEHLELRAGMVQIGKQVLSRLARLLDRNPHTGIPNLALADNPYWPAELAAEPALPHERSVTLLPLAFSRTQDDKGRVRWTLFGNSEQGPGKAFWKAFFTAPKRELPADEAVAFFSRLLKTVYGEDAEGAAGLKRVGFRILPDDDPPFDFWAEDLPSWTADFVLPQRPPRDGVKYLLTFRPFDRIPAAIRKAYFAGQVNLLPFPGSLTYWGVPGYRLLHRELPLALQIPLLLCVARHRVPEGVRVPQSGFLHEPTTDRPSAGHHAEHVRNTFKRTHRWDKILRDQDELALIGREDKLLHVLFSTLPNDLNLYDKPMARNVQLWTEDHRLLLDGPNATPEQLHAAMQAVEAGGLFGYRFQFPAMRVGRHEVYWHRPLVAYRNQDGEPVILHDAPTGYFTAYDTDRLNLARPVELWPRFRHRPVAQAALALHEPGHGRVVNPTLRGVRKLLDACAKCGGPPLPRSVARALLAVGHRQTLESWLDALPESVAPGVRELIGPEEPTLPQRSGARVPDSLTYRRTATRSFEVKYWKAIAALGEGPFVNKNNADCCRDPITQKLIPYHERHLETLGDYLLAHYTRAITAARMTGKALAGEMPFQWQTDFDYSWMGGWLRNQDGAAERNIVMVIPGRDRKEAVIMSDHYDTAYMADRYEPSCGGVGARLSACGADDNHSATAAMMLAAPVFLEMSRKGLLARDIWLIHLTGEEFPSDCLGARALTERLIEGVLRLHLPTGKTRDLSGTRVRGLYVSDMIAHNNDREHDVFQISPGVDADSFRLAEYALRAAEVWNESVPVWNERPERAGRPRGRRSPHGAAIPEVAPHLALSAEIRTPVDPRSTLYNTDGQIFSDAGVPCVLFMENYDIDRSGYHDTHDTMANIDLDYGAAVCAITIESVARAATVRE
jgi:hypothetical protein